LYSYTYYLQLRPDTGTAWLKLVERRAVIERLRNLGSTPDAVARRCVLGKDNNAISQLKAKRKHFTRRGGPA